MRDNQVACCRLPRTFDAPRHARDVAADAFGHALEPARRSDVALVVGELANNAVQHGIEPIGFRVTRRDDAIRVELHDGSPTLPVVNEPTDAGGFGMRLIAALADRWGADVYDGRGKRVWAEFSIDVQR